VESFLVTPDTDAYRAAMARLVTGVTVLATRGDAGPELMTASAVTSVSLEPPLLLASIGARARWLRAVRLHGRFAVNVLAAHHQDVARWCAGQARHSRPQEIMRRRVSLSEPSGLLTFDDALLVVECAVHDEHPAGDHVLMLGAVVRVDVREGNAEPLVYFDRTYGTVLT
jgi:flavin reductase (DIM6/NTAB) family NADH-FMN oxidoreductase RutF